MSVIAIAVCLGWIVGQPEYGHSASLSFPRLAQLKDGDLFYTNLGKVAAERGDNHRAIRLLTSAIERGAGAVAFRYRAQAYESLGKHEKATADLNRYIELMPRDPWGYTKRGTWYSQASQHHKAVGEFLKAAKLDPSFAPSHFGLGMVYTALEHYESAVHEFRKVLDLEPDNSDALLNLGVALMRSGRALEARTVLSKSLQGEKDPERKARIEQLIASLPSTTETGEPSVNGPTGPLDDTNPESRSVETAGRSRIESDPVPDENDAAGYNHRKDRDLSSNTEPGVSEKPVEPSWESEPTESHGASSQQNPLNLTGRWNTEYQGLAVEVTMKQVGETLSGVTTVSGRLIRSRTFHFNGTFMGDTVTIRSSEGHTFQGKVDRTGKVSGRFDIKGGPVVPVSFNVKSARKE